MKKKIRLTIGLILALYIGVQALTFNFSDLGEQAKLQYEQQEYEQLEKTCKRYLLIAKFKRFDWNYGNAIHDANMYLGLCALKNDNAALAKEHLAKSAKSPGSPQLDTFGPIFLLAEKLLLLGEKDAVITYLETIQNFWEMDDGRIDTGIRMIKNGETPRFNSHNWEAPKRKSSNKEGQLTP